MEKQCFKCHLVKPMDDFYKHPRMADGRLGKCKECTKMDVKIRYITEHDKIVEYERRRSKTNERKNRVRAHRIEWIKRNPEKYTAMNMLSAAIRDGKMERGYVCEICGGTSHIHAHHHDYSKPFDVIWLCAKCHGQIQ